MRVVVNNIAASNGGAWSILEDFYQDIKTYSDEIEWILLVDKKKTLVETNNIKIIECPEIKKSWIKRLMFDFVNGKKIVNSYNPDVYFSMQNTATLGVKARQVVYLHQSLPYQKERDFSFLKKQEQTLAVYQKIIGRIFNLLFKFSKCEIIVQTNWMKDSLLEKVKNMVTVIPPKVKVINNNTPWNGSDKNYFFYPANGAEYKNHEVIFKAVDIVISQGYTNFQIILTINQREVNNIRNYMFLGTISREAVCRYYNQSILLFPSYIETYGMPLKEAQFFGAPIIASNTLFSKEILKNYPNAVFFEKYDSEELAKIMIRYINDEILIVPPIKESDSDKKLVEYLTNSNHES